MPAPPLVLAAHTISGVLPGDPLVVRHDLGARLFAARQAGFTGLCLHLRDYAQLAGQGVTDAQLRALYASHAMSVPAIEFLGDWHHATQQAQDTIALAFKAAQALQTDVINIGLDALGDAQSLDQLVRPLRDLAMCAADQGLRLALEPVAWGQGETLQQALDLIDKSGGPVGLVIDIWHLAWRGIAPEALRQIPPEMVLGLQISDSAAPANLPPAHIRHATQNRLLCGTGALDLAGYLAIAADCGWRAPIAVEVISPDMAASEVAFAAVRAYETASPFVTKAWS